jgi:hypothetical protein
VACKVVVEKILEVGDQRSIMKTFYVIAGVQNIGIAIAILALFLLSLNFHKIKIPTVSTKELYLSLKYKKISQKNTKFSKRYAKIIQS